MANNQRSSVVRWRITFGARFQVTDGGGNDHTPRARKSRGLLAYLSLKDGHAAPRREIVDLLWSDRGPEQARASLRQCLFELKSEAPGADHCIRRYDRARPDVAITGGDSSRLDELADLDPAFERWRVSLADGRAVRTGSIRGTRWWMIAIPAVLAGTIAWWAFRDRPADFVPDVAIVTSATPSGVSQTFADAANRAMPGRYLHVRTVTDEVHDADWIARVGPAEAGSIGARITTAAGQELWAERLPVARDDANIGAELGRRAGETMLCTTRAPGGPPRDSGLLTLVMDVCGKLARRDDSADSRIAAQRLTAAYPDYAYGHGVLAMNLSYAQVPPALAESTAREADREARRALALDPRTGEAWMALANQARKRRQYQEAERLLRRGIAAQPDHGSLNNFLAALLADVGRTAEALVELFEPVEQRTIHSLLTAMRNRVGIPPDLQARLIADGANAAALLRTLVVAGQISNAAALAKTGRVSPADLFRPDIAPLGRDRSFPEIAATRQLWRYWTATGRWPDICADRALAWRCGDAVKSASAPH